MKIKMLAIPGLLFALVGLSLSEDGKQQNLATTNFPPQTAFIQATKAKKSAQFTVIGYLEKRDRVITIKSGPKGTVYTVATKDGKVLHENLSAEQLKAQAPDVFGLIKTGVAGDARVRPQSARVQRRMVDDARF
jgi:hypothetical protein